MIEEKVQVKMSKLFINRALRVGMQILVFLIPFYFIYQAQANILGVSYQSFNPTPDQTDYITVHSTESVRAKKWRMNIFGFVSGNNLVAHDPGSADQKPHDISDQLTSASLGMAYGITSNLELGVSLPININHRVAPESDRSYIVQRMGTMIHTQMKYVFQRRGENTNDPRGWAVVGSLGMPNTRQDGYLGNRQNPIISMEFIYDHGNETESYSFNAGYRARSPGDAYIDSPVLPLEDQFIFSAAFQRRFLVHRNMSWIAEFYGSTPTDKGKYQRAKDISTSEFIFGIRGGKSKKSRWTVGGGTEVFKGMTGPDWRVFAGWSWDFTWSGRTSEKDSLLEKRKLHGVADDILDPLSPEDSGPVVEDGDRDGILDDDDMCPRTLRGVKVDRDGCPLDADNDSIPDYEDRCPSTPAGDVVNGQGCTILK